MMTDQDKVDEAEFKRMLKTWVASLRNSDIPIRNRVGWVEGSGCTSKHFLAGRVTPKECKRTK